MVQVRANRKAEQGAKAEALAGEFRGEHEAPDPESGAPMHNLTGVYPEDIHGPNGMRLYGNSDEPGARDCLSLMQAAKGKPRMSVKVFRAVPYVPTGAERIAHIEECKRLWQRRNTVPNDAPKPPAGVRYYDHLCNLLNDLLANPPVDAPSIRVINPGDWVSPSRAYAVEHGQSNLNNNYKIVSKTVPASSLYTDGDSPVEWGYWPEGSYVPTPAEQKPEAVTKPVGLRGTAVAQKSRQGALETWFKGSAVVDAAGAPLVVFHGGRFNPDKHGVPETTGKGRKNYQLPFGMHFAENQREAEAYMASDGTLTQAYLAIKNPLRLVAQQGENDTLIWTPLTKAFHDAMPAKLRKHYDDIYSRAFADTPSGFGYHEWLEGALDRLKPLEAADAIKAMGFDGVIYQARANYGNGTYRPFLGFIIFEPTQVKAAYDNRGSFDPLNPDIRG